MKLRTEISWWFPGGVRIVYQGTPKTRAEWVRLTWRGYVAWWRLVIRAYYLLVTRRGL